MKRQYLNDFFQQHWGKSDPFGEITKIEGETFRDVKNRHTMRFEIDGRGFFIKIHRGVGWKEILKNIFQFKLPILGAANEYDALNLLHKLNVPTMTAAAFAIRGKNPAKLESFLITEELTNVESLEDYAKRFRTVKIDFRRKLGIIRQLARSSRLMQENGINHRDYYICHFLMDLKSQDVDNPTLYMIDLHRAGLRNKVPYRYKVKDIGGLFFSAMDENVTRR
ncbi:MAG: lipopolysaccharide core heptose(I) kinase RfaP, partial [Victivallaceae bacterium]